MNDINIFSRKRQEIYHELLQIGLEHQECSAEAKLILEHVTGIKHVEQITSTLSDFKADWLIEITRIINARRQRKPLAYCLGEADFGGLKFRVIPGVLIPRTDTETLVEVVINRLRGSRYGTEEHGRACCAPTRTDRHLDKSTDTERIVGADCIRPLDQRVDEQERNQPHPPVRIAEIGVGSGAIAISLLMRLPECTVWGCDISEAAINTTLGNARRHNVHERLTLVHGDWKKILPKDFDVIVSNPPYVPSSLGKKNNDGQSALEPEIYFEPHEALFTGGEDGLDFYRQFAQILPAHFLDACEQPAAEQTKPAAFAGFEIGDGQEQAVLSIFEQNGWQNLQIENDVNGLARVLAALPPQ